MTRQPRNIRSEYQNSHPADKFISGAATEFSPLPLQDVTQPNERRFCVSERPKSGELWGEILIERLLDSLHQQVIK